MIRTCIRLLFLLFLLAMTDAHASWLHTCIGTRGTDAAISASMQSPDGEVRSYFIDDRESHPGCRSRPLPLPADAVAAIKPIPAAVAGSIADKMVLRGEERDGNIQISSVEGTPSGTTAARSAAPLRTNLMEGLRLQTFGVEERVAATLRDGVLELRCRAGNRPAGVVLHSPWYLPQASLRLLMRGRGTGRFEILLADAKDETSARRIGRFAVAASPGNAALAVPAQGFNRRNWQSMTVACPNDEAVLRLETLQLEPVAGTPTKRAMWAWQPAAWRDRPAEIFALAAKYGARQLFVSIPVIEGRIVDVDKLAEFIRQAAQLGLQVWSVDGDPHMVLPSEHAPTAMRMRAYAVFNASHLDTPIAGTQWDIEPYLLPGYEHGSRQWEDAYIALVRSLRHAGGNLPLELVVPFWWGEKESLLNRLASHADSLCVMDYRTDSSEIIRFAIPFLDWGNARGKKVRIALESGSIAIEVERHYERAAEGDLWLLDDGPSPLLLLLHRPFPLAAPLDVMPAAAKAFRLAGHRMIDGTATSYLGDAPRLLSALPALEADFSAWRSFAGMALHEVK